MSLQDESILNLCKKIGEIKVGMFTTWHDEDVLHARPMTVLEVGLDGYVWFFSSMQSSLVLDIAEQPLANISFSEPKDNFYVSLAGRAEFIKDRAQVEALWQPSLKPWFPGGIDDPDLILICFHILDALYWDAESSRMVKWIKLLAATASGEQAEIGRHGHIRFH